MTSERRVKETVKFWRACSFVFGLACFLHICPPAQAEHLPIKTYTVADGLPRDSVQKIVQDTRGFLWFCTADGISRFDGYGFTNFTMRDGLPDRHVNDLLEASDGTIWIATDEGLARLNPKGLASSKEAPLFTIIRPDNPRAKKIFVLFEDKSGAIFAGTDDGLYKLTGQDELEAIDLGKPLPNVNSLVVTSIIRDRRGALWVGTGGSGIFHLLPGGEIEQYTIQNGFPGNDVASLIEDRNGRIWVGMRPGIFNAGLCLLVAEPQDGQNIVERVFTTEDGLPSTWISALYQSKDDKLWVATTGGLCQWQGENGNSVCKTYTEKNGLCDTDVWAITEDKDNNLWVGSQCGVKKWARYGFTTYTEADGTGYSISNSFFENAQGEFFASFNTGTQRTISRFDGEKFELVKPNLPENIKYFGWGWKQTVLEDHTGEWWIPTGEGLYRFSKPARFEDLSSETPQKVENGGKSAQVFRIFEDSLNNLWVSTIEFPNELLHWDRNANIWHNITEELHLSPKLFFTTFVEDQEGNLWIGTGIDGNGSSLIRYHDGQYRIFTEADGVPAGWIRDAFVDHAGRLWLADPTAGLLRLDDVNADQLDFVRYTPTEGLSSIGTSCITEDGFGRIYVGTGRGIDRLNPENGQVENFTTADGLPNSNVDIAYRDKKNSLWFGTSNGLARFDPEPERIRQSPNALITSVRVSGVAQNVSILGEAAIPALELNSDQRQVTVEFVGLGSSLGEKLKYEYRFGGSDWIPTAERTVNFANLDSGNYQFEVRSQTADRLYSGPATLAFRIAAPVWQRWWFIAGLLALAAFLIFVFYRYRLSRLLEVERIRTRIATDLHDDIGANLTKIAIMSEVAQRNMLAGTIGQDDLLPSIAEISRQSVSAMGDIVWAINPKKDSLDDLIFRMQRHARETLEQRDIQLEFSSPGGIRELRMTIASRRNIYLIFKEILHNIVRHSDAKNVNVTVEFIDTKLTMTVSDDGCGFDINADHDGIGLANIRKRAEELGGQLDIRSIDGDGTFFKLQVARY
jgi:ligand-binding sensor domain-containing protein/signal transduction histidine kinase